MDTKTALPWATIVAAGLFLRAAISLHSYSGQNQPPKYGDYEAQRHWQEVTVNLPVSDWYRNTTDNDPLYWGLDYPPLSAYHSYLVGLWARRWHNESYVALHESRGISTDQHKQFMRNTVLLLDVLLYLPAILYATYTVRKRLANDRSEVAEWASLTLAVLFPGQILIDNGHFQYNNASLGLCALAVVALLERRTLAGAVLFCLALNYKQMELYHALPFFFYLLRDCFTGSDKSSTVLERLTAGVSRLAVLGVTVLATFLVLWLPWLSSLEAAGQLVHRIFPVARGVFEDKVSNVWCMVNVLVKLRNFPNTTMALVCLLCTLLAVLPSGLHLLLQKSPTVRSFLYSLAVTALGFFLFSFHVHEKSILLVALPVTLLLPLEPLAACWFLQIATFSMFPLLHKDGLTVPFVGLSLISLALLRTARGAQSGNKTRDPSYDLLHLRGLLPESVANNVTGSVLVTLFYSSLLGQVLLLVAFLCLPAPAHLPFLHSLAISAYSCGHFVLFYMYFNYRQFCGAEGTVVNKQPTASCCAPANMATTAVKHFEVSAPGKVILHGEHSVVYGHPAIAGSIGLHTYLNYTALERSGSSVSSPPPQVIIEFRSIPFTATLTLDSFGAFLREVDCSESLQPEAFLEQLRSEGAFPFARFLSPGPVPPVLEETSSKERMSLGSTLYILNRVLRSEGVSSIDSTIFSEEASGGGGFRLSLYSEMSIGAGLGSSASYGVCLAAGAYQLSRILKREAPVTQLGEDVLKKIYQWSFDSEIIMHVKPSGIDNEIATNGGLVRFRRGSGVNKIIALRRPVHVLIVDTGVSRSTATLVASAAKRLELFPRTVGPILQGMGGLVDEAIALLESDEAPDTVYERLGTLVSINNNLLRSLGVSHPALERIFAIAEGAGFASKLTGAGGGGCAFVLLPADYKELESFRALMDALDEAGFRSIETTVGTGAGVSLSYDHQHHQPQGDK